MRCLRLAHLAHLPAEEFQDKEGRVASHGWLVEAVAEQRSVPTALWVLYREWVDDVIDGQVEQVDAWHHFVVARALGSGP